MLGKSNHIVNHDQIPANNVPVEINTLEKSVCNNIEDKTNFENDLTSASEEAANVQNNCGENLNNFMNEVNERERNEECELDDNCTDDTENSSSEHEMYDTELDEIYHVPKHPVFNGNTLSERRSNLKRKAVDTGNEKNSKRKRTIQFEGVTVFYFPRSQGFTCVPSQGGSTLGMSRRHFSIKSFSLSEHAAEQRKSHRDYLLRLRRQRNNQERKEIGSQCSSSEESEENSEEASDVSDSELEADSFFFLQPLPIRQRRALLRQSGIRQIEGLEKDECKDIRISREMCGCQCKVYCDPNSCQCSQAGIKCQVDRHSFPCGCSRDGCNNPNGRIEFNPIRVRTHFLHTLMRLEIEKCQSQHQKQWEMQQQHHHQQQQQQQRGESSLDLTKVTSTSWLQTNNGNSCTATFGTANGNVIGSSLPFFASQDPALQINPATELHPGNVGSSPIYPPFELRQVDNSSSNNASLFPSGSAHMKTPTPPYHQNKNQIHINVNAGGSLPDLPKGSERESPGVSLSAARSSTTSATGLNHSPGPSRLSQESEFTANNNNNNDALNTSPAKGAPNTKIYSTPKANLTRKVNAIADNDPKAGLDRDTPVEGLERVESTQSRDDEQCSTRNEVVVDLVPSREKVLATDIVSDGAVDEALGTTSAQEEDLVKGGEDEEPRPVQANNCHVQNHISSSKEQRCDAADDREVLPSVEGDDELAHPISMQETTIETADLEASDSHSLKKEELRGGQPDTPDSTLVLAETAIRSTQSTNASHLASDNPNQNDSFSYRSTPVNASEALLGAPPAKSNPEPASPRDNIQERKTNILEGVPA